MSATKNRYRPGILFLLLLAANILVFSYRDYFQYQPYVGYHQLYTDTAVRTMPQNLYTPAELNRAHSLLPPAPDGAPAISRLEQISTFLLNRFAHQRGIPSQQLLMCPPLAVFDSLTAVASRKAWCGQFAELMLLFASAEGIRGRYIEIRNPGNYHVFNEFYVPELRRWVMTDMYNDVLFARSERGELLNGQQFRSAMNGSAPLFARVWTGQGVQWQPLNRQQRALRQYHTAPNPYFYYTTTRLEQVYRPVEKLKRYFWPQSWYYIYADNRGSNLPFYGKLALLALTLLAGVLWATKLLNRQHD